jgi:ATP-dependent protease ClpP protease subunit
MSRNTPWRTTRLMYALHQPGKNDWYRIKNQVDGPTQVFIYDEIGYFGVGASEFIRDVADVHGPLDIRIHSSGGEVFDGLAIYNALIGRKDVTVYVDGLAASIASVIAMAGNPVLIARQAQMMVHDGFAQAIGNAADLRELADHLDRTSNQIASVYSDHTGRPVSYWRDVMRAETWYLAPDAIEAGLADRLIESGAGRPVRDPTEQWDLSQFRNSGHLLHRGQVPVLDRHTPTPLPHETYGAADMGVEYPWDPDGDGDDDSKPDTDYDHSHWNEAGGQILSVPGRPLDEALSLVDIMNASVDSSPWDAGRAWRAGTASSNPAAFFKAICAGRRSGPPDERGSWALPHHYKPGAAPNAAGVRAALGRLNQTQGLTNKDAAKSHLQAHMRAINPDWEPSDDADNPFGLSEEDLDQFARELRGA